MPLYLNKYTIGAIFYITSIIASGWLSANYMANSIKLDWEQERVELNKATSIALSLVNMKNKELNLKLSELDKEIDIKSGIIEVKTVEVEKEVIKYVQNYVAGDCPIDNDRLRIKNQSIATTHEFAKTTITPTM